VTEASVIIFISLIFNFVALDILRLPQGRDIILVLVDGPNHDVQVPLEVTAVGNFLLDLVIHLLVHLL